MNDITALMATMKAAAEKAIEANERLCVMPPDEIYDVSLAHSKQLDADITVLNAHYNESTPANVKMLVEALEKAQQQKESDFEIKARLCKESNGLHDRSREADKRITELESRTVTVKLPPRVDSSNVPFTAHTWNCCLDEVEKRLTAAGIQVIEGEG